MWPWSKIKQLQLEIERLKESRTAYLELRQEVGLPLLNSICPLLTKAELHDVLIGVNSGEGDPYFLWWFYKDRVRERSKEIK